MTSNSDDSNWPLPKFYFKVDLGSSTDVIFQEVSGLEIAAQPIAYRHANSPGFSRINMPGIVKNNNVTLKKGVFTKGDMFFDWYNKIKMNSIERRTVVIKLCDEGGNPTMTWTLANAWPSKISSTDLSSEANKVAVESIELSYEGLSIDNG